MLKLDKKDHALLFHLSHNSRIPISQLSKAVGISREVANYRLSRLVKKGIIVDFITEIDERKLGFGRHLIYLVFQNLNEAKEKEIISYLVDHPFVSWTTTSTGKWSIIFDYISQDLSDVHIFLDELKSLYGSQIGDYIVASQISFGHFHHKYYTTESKQGTVKKKRKKLQKHSLDTKDMLLLSLLSNNARLDYVALSKKLDLSANAVKNRLKALQSCGVITGFTIHPNKILLGFNQYYIQLDFVNQTSEQEKAIIEYIKEHPNMNAYYRPLGHWSIEIAVFAKHPGKLRKIILELRNHFGQFIKIHDTMLFYEEPKSNYLPKGVFSSHNI